MNVSSSIDDRLAARLNELRAEFGRGEAQLTELDQRRAALRDTLLRISGAMQVIQELLSQQPAPAGLFNSQPQASQAELAGQAIKAGIPANLDAPFPPVAG